MKAMRRMKTTAAVAALVLALGACSDATDIERLEISASGAVVGQAYLDLNGNGEAGAQDEPMAGVSVVLSGASGGAEIATAETDEEGVFLFEEVPVGRYTLAVAPGVLADSLVPVGEAAPFDVVIEEPVELVIGATYPALTVQEAQAAEPGRRVFTTGIALNARQSFSDGRVFLKGAGGYLQATSVARSTPAVSVGDSVRFLGTTTREAGRPGLDDVTPYILVQQAQVPIPVEVSTETAATADGGALDAALVVIRTAVVSDTMTVTATNDFRFLADDGSGPTHVVLRSFLGIPRPAEGDTVSAVGMLSPFDDGSGVVQWELLVRAPSELAIIPVP